MLYKIIPDFFRCGILDTFQGKRTGWQNGNWSGDYCSDDPNFTSAVNALRTKQSIGKVLFAGRGTTFIHKNVCNVILKV